MKVMKFGGRSLGTPERMLDVVNIISANDESKIIVLSALGGTTQALREIGEALQNNRRSQARNGLKKLETYYREFINGLLQTNEAKTRAFSSIDEHFAFLQFILKISYSEALAKDIVSQGELMSTVLMSACMSETKKAHAVLPALDFMQTDKYHEPQIGNIKVKLTQLLNQYPDQLTFLTQGSVCRNHKGELDNLSSGGSDYTASSIAAAMGASVCEIWSDIPAMQNNDSSLVGQTKPVETLSFDEAAELAYFGEKVLHPASVWPARHYGITVKLLNTQQPDAAGTAIVNMADSTGAKVVAARDGITSINVKSSRMLMAYGFLQKILEVFEKYKISVDMVTTSEVAVSVTIDDSEHLPLLAKELEAYGVVSVEENQTIVTIVGNEILHSPDIMKKLFSALSDIPLQMASYGGSKHNVSLLIPTIYKVKALKGLHEMLFESI